MNNGTYRYIDFALVALATPFLLFPGPLTFLSLALVIVSWAIRLIRTKRFSISTWMNTPSCLLLATAIGALYPSVDIGLSSSKVWGIFLGVVIFFAVVNGVSSVKEFWIVMWALLFIGVSVSVLALVGTDWKGGALIQVPVIYDNIPTLVRGIPGSGLSSPTDLFNAREVGGTLAMLLPVGMAAALTAHNSAARGASVIGTCIMGAVLLLSQSPSAILGAGFALLAVTGAWYRRLLMVPVASLGLFLMLAPPLILNATSQSSTFAFAGEENVRASFGILSRIEIWNSGLLMLRDRPFTGIGINTFSVIFDNFYPTLSLGNEPHAHNILLQVALDLGAIGLFAFLWLLGAFYFSISRAYRRFTDRRIRTAVTALGASIAAYLIFGSIDAITLGAKPGPAMWAVFALAGALTSLQNEIIPAPNPARQLNLLVFATALVFLVLFSLRAFAGGVSLNLGLVDAHKGIVESRRELIAPRETLRISEEHLISHLKDREGDYYAYSHLGSVQGWLGKDKEAVDTMRSAAAAAWAGLPRIHAPALSPSRDPAESPATQQRAKDVVYILDQWSVRYPTRWEVYLQKAEFLYYELNSPELAKAALGEGMERSPIKGPLELFAQEIK